MTLAEAKAKCRSLGFSLRKKDDEYRLNVQVGGVVGGRFGAADDGSALAEYRRQIAQAAIMAAVRAGDIEACEAAQAAMCARFSN
jgi:hypothetical protein